MAPKKMFGKTTIPSGQESGERYIMSCPVNSKELPFKNKLNPLLNANGIELHEDHTLVHTLNPLCEVVIQLTCKSYRYL